MTESHYGSNEQAEGLLPKYSVIRTNGNLWKHAACRYFVLDPQHDLIARRALAYYANDAREEGYTALADDLEAWVRSLWDATAVSAACCRTKAENVPTEIAGRGECSWPNTDCWVNGPAQNDQERPS